jgi:hypothetical protein
LTLARRDGENPPMRKLVRRVVVLSLLGALAYAAWRALRTPPPAPALPQAHPEHLVTIPPGVELEGGPEVDGEVTGIEPWVDPADGACPASHPVKAKLASGIFHVPGGSSYDRTHADRCYVDDDAATADGLRRAKR